MSPAPGHDAGRNVVWDTLSWTESAPSRTDITLQVAYSDSADGPWSYVGPDGTPGTTFDTAAGTSVGASVISRYCRYQATLTGNGSDTPTLEAVELSFSGSIESQLHSFSFDAAGNLTEKTVKTDSTEVTETRTYNDLNEIEDNVIDDGSPVTWTYTHDSMGNLTSKTNGTELLPRMRDTYDFSWDDQNRLLGVELNSVAVVSYVYDSSSRMLQRVEGSTTTTSRRRYAVYHWDGWNLIREEKTTGAVTETTNYLVPRSQIYAFERGGDWYYLHGDALSSTQLITDENGDQVGRFIYGAWGEELYAVESLPGILENRFVGGLGCRRDAATGLIYMRHRWYDCQLQRFISRDPIGLKGGTNLYSYGAGNPVNNVDAWGLDPSVWVGVHSDSINVPPPYGDTAVEAAKYGDNATVVNDFTRGQVWQAITSGDNDIVVSECHSDGGTGISMSGNDGKLLWKSLKGAAKCDAYIVNGCDAANNPGIQGLFDTNSGQAVFAWNKQVDAKDYRLITQELTKNLQGGGSATDAYWATYKHFNDQDNTYLRDLIKDNLRFYGDTKSSGLVN